VVGRERLCGRPGCGEPATASFTFNSGARAVWLDHIGRIDATAGYICHRHADTFLPPRGWELHDRRDFARVLDHRGEQQKPRPEPEADPVLDAQTPLLARAFRGARRAS
jgi:hypothetical protein